MSENVHIRLTNEKNTKLCGRSLVASLYRLPLTIGFIGELGAGKTTFIQGFAEKLGIEDHLASPTYALEHRYQGEFRGESFEFLHLDLYRLDSASACEILESTDTHEGIRCIEWIDRIEGGREKCDIVVEITDNNQDHPSTSAGESRDFRLLSLEFNDLSLPFSDQIFAWREEMQLPAHICAHCDCVADIASILADRKLSEGIIVRKDALDSASRLHDLLRFVDFKPGGSHIENSKDTNELWDTLKDQYKELRHEGACAKFLTEKGYEDLGTIVSTHGHPVINPERKTIEQKLLFYADKRAVNDQIVTVSERYEDFRTRYTDGEKDRKSVEQENQVLAMECELFGEEPNLQ